MRLLVLGALLAAAACADSGDDTTTTTSSHSASNASAATTGTGGMGTGGAGNGGSGGGVVGGVRAFGYSGGLEHLVVVKSDPERDTCARVFLSAPSMSLAVPITVPAEWGIDAAEIGHGAAICNAVDVLMMSQAPNGAGGSISWTPPMTCAFCIPTSLDIHATLTFPPGDPWVPATEALDADGVMVESWQ